MLIWMLSGLGVLAFLAVLVMRDAIADDKRRKVAKRTLPNNR